MRALTFPDRAAAATYGQQLRAAIEAPAIPHRGLAAGQVVTASIGLACGDTSYVAFEKLLTSADTALYAAKDGGRNVVVMAEEFGTVTLPLRQRKTDRTAE